MKYLKRFNESSVGKDKFCHECGEKLERTAAFCGECGEKQHSDNSTNNSGDFTIEGEIHLFYTGSGNDYAKTPIIRLSSPNKTLDSTQIKLENFNWMDLSNKLKLTSYYQGKSKPKGVEVRITGTTPNGQKPSFENPLIVDKVENIEKI